MSSKTPFASLTDFPYLMGTFVDIICVCPKIPASTNGAAAPAAASGKGGSTAADAAAAKKKKKGCCVIS